MGRSLPFRNLARSIGIAHYCDENNIRAVTDSGHGEGQRLKEE